MIRARIADWLEDRRAGHLCARGGCTHPTGRHVHLCVCCEAADDRATEAVAVAPHAKPAQLAHAKPTPHHVSPLEQFDADVAEAAALVAAGRLGDAGDVLAGES